MYQNNQISTQKQLIHRYQTKIHSPKITLFPSVMVENQVEPVNFALKQSSIKPTMQIHQTRKLIICFITHVPSPTRFCYQEQPPAMLTSNDGSAHPKIRIFQRSNYLPLRQFPHLHTVSQDGDSSQGEQWLCIHRPHVWQERSGYGSA